MAHIAIGGLSVERHESNENQFKVNGSVISNEGTGAAVPFAAGPFNFSSVTPAGLNSAVIAAAIAAILAAEEIEVGPLDNRTIVGGGVGL